MDKDNEKIIETANAVTNHYIETNYIVYGQTLKISKIKYKQKAFINTLILTLAVLGLKSGDKFEIDLSALREQIYDDEYDQLKQIISDRCLDFHNNGTASICNYSRHILEDKGLQLFFIRCLWISDHLLDSEEDYQWFSFMMFEFPLWCMYNSTEYSKDAYEMFIKRFKNENNSWLPEHWSPEIWSSDFCKKWQEKILNEYEMIVKRHTTELCPTMDSYKVNGCIVDYIEVTVADGLTLLMDRSE